MERRTGSMTDIVITEALEALLQMLITTEADIKITKNIPRRTLRKNQRRIHVRNQRRTTRRIPRRITTTTTDPREARAEKARVPILLSRERGMLNRERLNLARFSDYNLRSKHIRHDIQ